jgi:pilus assembly protein CpaC
MLRTALAALALASGGLLATPAQAQYSDASLHAGALEVPVNKSQVVSVDRPIGKAMIGNPAVADIVPITTRSIYVLGKTLGTTSLTLYDSSNRVLAIMDVEVGPDVEGLRRQINDLVPNQQISARISACSIVL